MSLILFCVISISNWYTNYTEEHYAQLWLRWYRLAFYSGRNIHIIEGTSSRKNPWFFLWQGWKSIGVTKPFISKGYYTLPLKDTLIIYKGTINTASFTSRMNPPVLVELCNYPMCNKGIFSVEASFRGNWISVHPSERQEVSEEIFNSV